MGEGSFDAPSFSNFLKLLSSDQRRRIVSIVYKNGQRKVLARILALEDPKAQEYFQKWKEYEESKRSDEEQPAYDTNTSQVPPCASDSEDEDDPDNPDKWTPKIRDDFFEGFPDEMNILLLGETGVGKSTFINALANYLQFSNIYQARDHFEILIKAAFTHSDKDFNQRRIECMPTNSQDPNDVDNEKTEVGQSSTQAPKSYLIPYESSGKMKKIRIIDTPGIGDSRGIEQEKINFNQIMKFIVQYKKLHAICILMKPNENRLALNFRYCLNELFAHLHKSASKNILFCFTNSRETLYQPGDVLPTLRAFLEKIQEKSKVEIPLDLSTTFCFDNESFRALCAWREGEKFTKEEIANFSSSWKITVKQTFRLLKRISQLPPHKVEDTIAVNNARAAVLGITKPAAEFSNNHLLNLQMLDRKITEIEDCIKTGTDLEGKLFVEQVELIPEELSQPITVCSAPSCIAYKKTSDDPNAKMEIDYKTICHSPCYLDDVPTEICPNPAIRSCYIFQTSDGLCRNCHCGWEYHIHRQYRLNKKVKKIVDPSVEECLKKNTDRKVAAELFLANEKERKKKLEKLSNTAMVKSVELAAYIKENSLVPYNDVYKDRMEQLIAEEKKAVEEGGSSDKLQILQANKDSYDTHIQAIERQRNAKNTEQIASQIHSIVENFQKTTDYGDVLKAAQKIELISLEAKKTSEDVVIKTKGGWFGSKFSSFVDAAYTGFVNLASGAKNVATSLLSFGWNKKK